MSLHGFLDELFDSGRVQVPVITPLAPDELARAQDRLEAFESLYRQQMPGTPPPFAPRPALWAATMFYRSCQFLVHREYGAEQLEAVFAQPCPDRSNPSAHYAVDLTFRMLPDLMRLACAKSQKDPLVAHLNELAKNWPLSSVGVTDVAVDSENIDVAPIVQCRSLLMLYVDRIIAGNDTSRLADPRIRDATTGALGLYPDMAPTIASKLDTLRNTETTG